MKIKALHISSFGGLKNTTLNFEDGFNIIYGNNENGKSTVMAFIKMMFYGNERNSSDISKNPRKKYLPWDNTAMAGSIDFEKDNRNYRLEREFRKSNSTDKVTLIDLDLGARQAVQSDIGVKLFGLSEAAFERSVFINQFGFPESNASAEGELNSKLSNIALTGDETVSFEEIKLNIEKLKYSLSSKSGKAGILDKNIKLKNELQDRIEIAEKAYKEIQSLKEKVKFELEKQTHLKNKLNSVKFDISKESDIKNAEKYKELLQLKAELDELNHSLTLKNGDMIDDMFVGKLKFCISKIERLEQRFEILSAQTENIEKSLKSNTSTNLEATPEKETEIRNKIENLEKEREATTFRRRKTEEDYNTLLESISSSKQKTVINIPIITLAVVTFCLSLIPIIKIPVKIGIIAVGVILLILSFIIKPKKIKEIESNKENLENLKELAINLKLKETELLSLLTAEKTNLSVITSALANNTSVLEKQQTLLNENKEQLDQLKQELENENNTLLHLYSVYEESSNIKEIFSKLQEITEKATKQKQLKQNINYILKDIGNITYDEAREKLNSMQQGVNLNVNFEELKNQSEILNQNIIDSNSVISSLNADIKMLTLKAENPETLKQKASLLEEKIVEQTEILNCCEIVLSTLEESFIEVRRSYGSSLEKEAVSIFSKLTDNKYGNMNISQAFDITVEQTDTFGGKELEYLSSGTVDQAYLSLRIALLKLMEQQLPLFMDDTLAQFDDERTKTALKFLAEYANENQIVLFTCHKWITEISKEFKVNEINL